MPTAAASAQSEALARWDIHCRVVDNFGDAGVCWRLAAGLAAAGLTVRLFIDDPAPLAFIAPQGAAGVAVLPWGSDSAPGEVVIEAFGCALEAATEAAIARSAAGRTGAPPVWINLEYLSAESYVERSHGLPSPQRNGCVKWFFYPGFTPRTGGLLRERGSATERMAFDGPGWLAAHGLQRRPQERVLSLFCYDNPALSPLLDSLAGAAVPTLLLATPGLAQAQVRAWQQAQPGMQPSMQPGTGACGALRWHALPWLDQPGFDRLLWASDLNFVRGEDSLVRALWAGQPLVWQIYPQLDGAHHAKLQALIERLALPDDLATLWWTWNGRGTAAPALPATATASALATAGWQATLQPALQRLQAQDDLVTQLRRFAAARRSAAG